MTTSGANLSHVVMEVKLLRLLEHVQNAIETHWGAFRRDLNVQVCTPRTTQDSALYG